MERQEFARDAEAEKFERFLKVEHLDADSLTIGRWGIVSDENLPPTFYKVFRRGDVLYPTRNPHLRRAAVASFDGICGEKTLTLYARESVILADYLPFIFQSESFIDYAIKSRVGSTNPHVRWRDLAAYEFRLPSKDEQRRIADMLWSAIGVVEHLALVRADIDALRRRVLTTRFARFKRSYEERPIRELGSVQLGRQRAPKYTTGRSSKRYLRVVNILDGELDLRDVQEMDFDDRDFDRYSLLAGDVLITEGDITSPFNVGRSAIFRGEIEECCFQNTLIRYRSDELVPEFAQAALQQLLYAGVFAAVARTTTVTHLGAERFGNITIPVPPRDVQISVREEVNEFGAALSGAAQDLRNVIALRARLREFLLGADVH